MTDRQWTQEELDEFIDWLTAPLRVSLAVYL
jgi:hypothetical protein